MHSKILLLDFIIIIMIVFMNIGFALKALISPQPVYTHRTTAIIPLTPQEPVGYFGSARVWISEGDCNLNYSL